MARARRLTMPARRAAQAPPAPALARPLRRWLAHELRRAAPVVAAGARACAADRCRKHFTATQHAWLLLFHGLTRLPSLRQSYAAFGLCAGLGAASGLGAGEGAGLGVSYSQYAASNTSRPPAFLAARVRALGPRGGPLAPPPELCLLDATFFRGCLRLAPWAPTAKGRRRRAAIRVQVEYDPALDLPEHVLVARGQPNDCRGLGAAILDDPARLAALAGRTLTFDLGFYSHARLARLLAAEVHVLTRLHPQAAVAAAEDRPLPQALPGVPAGRGRVVADRRVRLGSPRNRRGAALPAMRLVVAEVAPAPAAARRGARPVTDRVVTDRWDLAAGEVVRCYLWRWQIELFFRWLKRVVALAHLLGTSPRAVELTVWLALVVHLLCLLAAHALGLARRTPALLAQLPVLLGALTPADLAEPPAACPSPHQPSLFGPVAAACSP